MKRFNFSGYAALGCALCALAVPAQARYTFQLEAFTGFEYSDNAFREPEDDLRFPLYERYGPYTGFSRPQGKLADTEWSKGLDLSITGVEDRAAIDAEYRIESNDYLEGHRSDNFLLAGEGRVKYDIKRGRFWWNLLHSARQSTIEAIEPNALSSKDTRNTISTGPTYLFKLGRNNMLETRAIVTSAFNRRRKDLDGDRFYLGAKWYRQLSPISSVDVVASYVDARFDSENISDYSSSRLLAFYKRKQRLFDMSVNFGINNVAADKPALVPVIEIDEVRGTVTQRLEPSGKKQSRVSSSFGVRLDGVALQMPWVFALNRELTDTANDAQEPYDQYDFVGLDDIRIIERTTLLLGISRAALERRLNSSLAIYFNDDAGVDTDVGDKQLFRVIATTEYRLTDRLRVGVRAEYRTVDEVRSLVIQLPAGQEPDRLSQLASTRDRSDELVWTAVNMGYQMSPRLYFSASAGNATNDSDLDQFDYEEAFFNLQVRYRFDPF